MPSSAAVFGLTASLSRVVSSASSSGTSSLDDSEFQAEFDGLQSNLLEFAQRKNRFKSCYLQLGGVHYDVLIALQESGAFKGLRVVEVDCSQSTRTCALIIKRPHLPHEVAAEQFGEGIVDCLKPDLRGGFASSGPGSIRLVDTTTMRDKTKQADWSLASANRMDPPIWVIEVGLTEDHSNLIQDAKTWLLGARFDKKVSVCTTIAIFDDIPPSLLQRWQEALPSPAAAPSSATRSAANLPEESPPPKLLIEHWTRSEDGRSIIHHPRLPSTFWPAQQHTDFVIPSSILYSVDLDDQFKRVIQQTPTRTIPARWLNFTAELVQKAWAQAPPA